MKITSAILSEAITAYSGKKTTNLQFVQDPKVRGTYAIQCKINGTPVQFLLKGTQNMARIFDIEQNLEECEFTNWPPTSKSL